jgi:hypothetical protein
MNINDIQARASCYGIVLRGGFSPADEDNVPSQHNGEPFGTLLMFGQLGSSIWASFAMSEEFADGKPDPLDRWSLRIGVTLAEEFSGLALFPFEGPPWHPFGKWAQKAEAIRPSPLGILLHPHYGLWHAYRFAIALPDTMSIPMDLGSNMLNRAMSSVKTTVDSPDTHACDCCVDRPCLNACPVNAFTEGNYNVIACCDYLNSNLDAPCHYLGCRARGSCPEGNDKGYVKDHNQFHMRQFLLAMNQQANRGEQGTI